LFFNGQMEHSHLEIIEPSAILPNTHVFVCLSLIINVSFNSGF